ncbi:hypothetical protein MRY87_01365 [bacterium]|nr:hypothetical protein [bacterium]
MKTKLLCSPLVLAGALLFPFTVLAQNAFEGSQGDVSRSALPIYGGGVEDFAVASNGDLYAGLGSPNGIFCSSDGAATWSGPPTGSDFGSISAVAAGGDNDTVFFIGGIDLYRSTDGCQSFEELTSSSETNDFGQSLVFSNGTLMVAFRDGTVEVSTDNGESFTNRTVDAALTSLSALAAGTTAGTFFALGSSEGSTKLFRTTDSGVNWTELHTFTSERNELGVSPEDEDIIVASSNDGVEVSTDGGTSFAERTPPGLSTNSIRFVTINSTAQIAIGSHLSTDNGATWSDLNNTAESESVLKGHIVADPSNASTFYMSSNRGIVKSLDSTENWTDVVTGMLGVQIGAIAQGTDKNILYLAGLGGIARTTNYLEGSEAEWEYPLDVDGQGTAPTALLIPDPETPSTLLAAAFGKIFRSTTSGDSWSEMDTSGALENRDEVVDFAMLENGTYYAAFNNADDNSGGVAVSTDNGATWTDASLPNDPPVNTLLAVENTLFAGVGAENSDGATQRGIYRLASESWTQLSGAIEGKKINDLAWNETRVFASAGDVSDGGLYASEDSGDSWSDLSAAFTESRCLQTLAVNPENLSEVYVAFGCPAGTAVVYQSSDGGTTWETFYTGLKDEVPAAMLFDDLIVGLNTGAYEFGEEGTDVSTITLRRKKLRKKRRRTKYRFTATAKDEDGEAVSDEDIQLQFRRRKNQEWSDRGNEKTTNSAGKTRWKSSRKGFYRAVVPETDVASRPKRIR